jgi:hypothetical protein
VKEIESLLEAYATMLLRQGRRIEAIELFRKANYSEKSAQLLFQLAFEEVEMNASPSALKRLFVLAALEIERYKANSLSLHGLMVTYIFGQNFLRSFKSVNIETLNFDIQQPQSVFSIFKICRQSVEIRCLISFIYAGPKTILFREHGRCYADSLFFKKF